MTKKTKKQITELIILTGITLWCVLNYKLFVDFLLFLFKLVAPVLIGVGIAFVMNVPMKLFEKKIFKINKRKHKKFVRILSMILSFVLIVGIVSLIFVLIIPEIISAINILSKNVPSNFKFIQKAITKLFKTYPGLESVVKNYDYKSLIGKGLKNSGIITIVAAYVKKFVTGAISTFIGLIISFYILVDKENLVKRFKRIMLAFFPEKVAREVFKIGKLANVSFSKFITGQLLDASLIGFLFFIVLSVLSMPYALILGVLFTITALIPYIGGFITLVVGVILLGVTKPIYALWFVIIFIILQQFDDNFTYPRIVGGSVGLPALISLIAVLIGGSVFGFVGMIISIPIASVLYTLFANLVNDRLEKKGIETD